MKVSYAFEEISTNKAACYIHFTGKLPDYSRWVHDDRSTEARGLELKSKIQKIPGVIESQVWKGYRLSIDRGGAFSWLDILPQVLRAVAEFTNWDLSEIEPYPVGSDQGEQESD